MKPTFLLGCAALAGIATAACAADDELLILDWSGFEEKGFYPGYIEKYGEAPTFTFFGNEQEAFQKLNSGFRADISHPCPQSVRKWRDAGLLEPWDTSQIPRFEGVADVFRTAPVLTDGDDIYFIPADNGATAIAYNTEEVPEEDVASLDVFADPDYEGRISLPDNVDDAYALAYLATGTTDWTEATEEDFQAASDWLRKVHPNVRAYWTDGAELAQLMATGEVLISWAWNETPVRLSDEGHPIAYQREAEEGSSEWFCGYVNLKDGPGSEKKAHDFINAWLAPQVAEYIVDAWGYGHGNAEAMQTIPDKKLRAIGMGEVDAPVLRQLPMDTALREKMIAAFEKIKAGF